MNKRDYYEVLGVDKNASEKEIKTAFRKISVEHHPDKHPNANEDEKKKHEDLFKEAAEAYEVLSDKDKKQKYDRYGHGGMSMEDIDLDEFFHRHSGFGYSPFSFGQMHRQRKNRGEDIRIKLVLTLEELYNGTKKQLEVNSPVRCDSCLGSGLEPDGEKIVCEFCKGKGVIIQQQQMGYQTVIQQMGCPHCNQTGEIIKNPCNKCNGSGIMKGTKKIDITIKPGIQDGMVLRMVGEGGECADFSGINGDLHIIIKEKEHNKFIRNNQDLIIKEYINIIDSLLGVDKEIELIDGTKVKFKIPERTEDERVFRLGGKGMPIYNSDGIYGDLHVIVKHKLPNKISDKERKLLENLKKCENFK